MEPHRQAAMNVTRTLLRRPFPVRPFLSIYSTAELSLFMQMHLDPPFNGRFSRFIEVVNMTGSDFVRLSDKDLGRLCDGEGPHLYDLTTFQASLRPPSSPHVRDISSLPEVQASPRREPPDLAGSDVEIEFDFPEDLSDAHPLPSASLSGDAVSHTTLEDGEESLIDMFSPLPSFVQFDAESDEYSSSESVGPQHDIFDSPHLSNLRSPLASPYLSGDETDDDIDIIGLASKEVADLVLKPNNMDSDIDDLATLNLAQAASPQLRVAVAEVVWPTTQLGIPAYSPQPTPSGCDVIALSVPEESEWQEPYASSEFEGSFDLEQGQGSDGSGLSSFMSELRSLDSSLPPSPRFDSPYTLSELFSDASVLSGGSLGLSVSPELTIIQTPGTNTFNNDILIASPSHPYRGPDHLDAEQLGSKKVHHPEPDGIQFPDAQDGTARRPKIEVTIPSLPSLLDDEHLSALMSSIELAKARSCDSRSYTSGQASPPLSPVTWLAAHHDRSIWPLSSTSERFLPSPYMKNDGALKESSPKRQGRPGGESVFATSGLEGLGRSKSIGAIAGDPTEGAGAFSGASGKQTIQLHRQFASSPWGKVGEYIWTILTPIEADPGSEAEEDGVDVPGGL